MDGWTSSTNVWRRLAVPCGVVACVAAAVAPAVTARAQDAGAEQGDGGATAHPRHLDAMRRALHTLEPDARCERESPVRARCTFTHRGTHAEREHRFAIVYSEETGTVYAYADRYLVVPAGRAHTPRLLRRLAELNWELLVGKLEWNPTDGEVRLSAVMPVGAQFDGGAFRTLVRTVIDEADRHWRALARAAGEIPASTEP